MSCSSRLKFCSNIPVQFYITSFPNKCLLRHQEGTVLFGANRELVGARYSSSLSANISAELYNIYRQMEMYRPFLLLGVDVANVSANFVVTGLKQDNNTKLKMPNLPKSEKWTSNAFGNHGKYILMKVFVDRWV